MKVDNFALTMHQACPRRYYHRMVQGYTIRRRSAALGFGGALHAGLAEWYKHTHLSNEERLALAHKAIEANWDPSVPSEDYRTLSKCLDVMTEYARYYPEETFDVVGAPDRPIVEVTFTLETGMYLPCVDCEGPDESGPFDAHCSLCGVLKEPIQYGGIFDGLTRFGDKVYILEHKSTSQLGAYYFNQFKPNNQVTGYIWAATQLSGMEVAGAILNAIGVYKVGKTKFERSVSTRNAGDIDEWKMNVYDTCVEIAHHTRLGRYPQRTPSCTQYGLCEFHQVCTLTQLEHRQKRLDQDYVKSDWDYTRRDDNADRQS